jgi:hypothetical protein
VRRQGCAGAASRLHIPHIGDRPPFCGSAPILLRTPRGAQEPTSYGRTSDLAPSARFGFSVCVETPRIVPSVSTVDCALWCRRTVSVRSFEPGGGRPKTELAPSECALVEPAHDGGYTDVTRLLYFATHPLMPSVVAAIEEGTTLPASSAGMGLTLASSDPSALRRPACRVTQLRLGCWVTLVA